MVRENVAECLRSVKLCHIRGREGKQAKREVLNVYFVFLENFELFQLE